MRMLLHCRNRWDKVRMTLMTQRWIVSSWKAWWLWKVRTDQNHLGKCRANFREAAPYRLASQQAFLRKAVWLMLFCSSFGINVLSKSQKNNLNSLGQTSPWICKAHSNSLCLWSEPLPGCLLRVSRFPCDFWGFRGSVRALASCLGDGWVGKVGSEETACSQHGGARLLITDGSRRESCTVWEASVLTDSER